jgi:hypothetical protein
MLRLGHVAGLFQGLTEVCRNELLAPPVVIPDPDRLSNVTHTVTIVDALLAIAGERTGPPGPYDLVNVPQWTWRQVYESEAARLGVRVSFRNLETVPSNGTLKAEMTRRLFRVITGARTKDILQKTLSRMHASLGDRVRTEYFVDRARREIAALNTPSELKNPGALWAALKTSPLPGLADTSELLASEVYPLPRDTAGRWPADLSLNG